MQVRLFSLSPPSAKNVMVEVVFHMPCGNKVCVASLVRVETLHENSGGWDGHVCVTEHETVTTAPASTTVGIWVNAGFSGEAEQKLWLVRKISSLWKSQIAEEIRTADLSSRQTRNCYWIGIFPFFAQRGSKRDHCQKSWCHLSPMSSFLHPVSLKFGCGLWNGRAPDSGHYGRYCLQFFWPRRPLPCAYSPAAGSCKEWPRRIGWGRWAWKEPRQPDCGTLWGENQNHEGRPLKMTTSFRR